MCCLWDRLAGETVFSALYLWFFQFTMTNLLSVFLWEQNVKEAYATVLHNTHGPAEEACSNALNGLGSCLFLNLRPNHVYTLYTLLSTAGPLQKDLKINPCLNNQTDFVHKFRWRFTKTKEKVVFSSDFLITKYCSNIRNDFFFTFLC